MESRDRAMAVKDLFEFWNIRKCGPYLDTGRNFLTRVFMESDCEKLLFIDDDMGFDPEDIERISSHDVDLVGGVYLNVQQDGTIKTVSYEHEGSAGWKPYPLSHYDDATDLVPVDAVGTGFLCISRTLLTRFQRVFDAPEEFFAEHVIDGLQSGEDFTFCWRALNTLGVQPYVDPQVRLRHIKTVSLDPRRTRHADS